VIVDAHHHVWDPATADYPWLTDELAAIRRRFTPDDLAPELAAAGVEIVAMPEDEIRDLTRTAVEAAQRSVAALVIDSYDVTSAALGRATVPVAVMVDHVPSEAMPVRLLINSAVDADAEAWPTSPGTRLLLGPRYVLLRDAFAHMPRRPVAGEVAHVLVTTGGADSDGCSAALVRAVRAALPHAQVDVIVGPYFTAASIAALEQCAEGDAAVAIRRNVNDVSSLMGAADLTVSGGGQSTYELAATGTPTVGVLLAANQAANLRGLSRHGALVWAADRADADLEQKVAAAVATLASSVEARTAMSEAARAVVDGLGARRVAAAILEEGAA
jgi:spore coat polysaccharide biosynthesis predicted glycosyltransferase SpsG